MLNVVGSIYLFFFVRVLDDGDFFFWLSSSVGRSVGRPAGLGQPVGRVFYSDFEKGRVPIVFYRRQY